MDLAAAWLLLGEAPGSRRHGSCLPRAAHFVHLTEYILYNYMRKGKTKDRGQEGGRKEEHFRLPRGGDSRHCLLEPTRHLGLGRSATSGLGPVVGEGKLWPLEAGWGVRAAEGRGTAPKARAELETVRPEAQRPDIHCPECC